MARQGEHEGDAVIAGVVDHIVHVSYDEKTVLRLSATTGDESASVTALGAALFGARPGEHLRLNGHWVQHARYGRQFKVAGCERTMPADEQAIRLYLASGMIPGIGPVLARAVVDAFGANTLKVIDTEPDQLLDVHMIGPGRMRAIVAGWEQQKAIADIMVVLQGLGVSPTLAVRIYSIYADTEDDPLDVVRRTPYRLARDVHGVGFVHADRIALAVGIPKHSDARMQAALLHVLDMAGRDGDCHLPVSVLFSRTRKLLSDDDPATAEAIDKPVLRHNLEELCADGEAVVETLPLPVADHAPDAVAATEVTLLPRWHYDEGKLAEHVRRLLTGSSLLAGLTDWDERLAELASPETAGLTDEQTDAIRTALTRPLSVLTGGPGCGKTHTLRTR